MNPGSRYGTVRKQVSQPVVNGWGVMRSGKLATLRYLSGRRVAFTIRITGAQPFALAGARFRLLFRMTRAGNNHVNALWSVADTGSSLSL